MKAYRLHKTILYTCSITDSFLLINSFLVIQHLFYLLASRREVKTNSPALCEEDGAEFIFA